MAAGTKRWAPALALDENDDEDAEDEDQYEAVARTASCVGAIIARATGDYRDTPSPRGGPPSSVQEYTPSHSSAGDEVPTAWGAPDPAMQGATAGAQAGRRPGAKRAGARAGRSRAPVASGAAPNPHRGAEVERVLAARQCPAGVRKYASHAGGGFGRTPAFLRPVAAKLDAEQKYITALREPREAPHSRVRLLARGEREALVGGLRQQLQATSARLEFSEAAPAQLEAELARLQQDLENLDQPYVFVEDWQ